MSSGGHSAVPGRAVHVPVLLREVLQGLQLQSGLTVVDGTVGAAGHSSQIVTRIGPTGQLLGFDRDPYMLSLARQKLTTENVRLIHASYAELADKLTELEIPPVDRVLLDLGLSSDQLAAQDRGFSYHATGPLDLRFDTTQGPTAAAWLNTADRAELEHAFRDYGEEPFAVAIAQAILKRRLERPIESAADLTAVIHTALPHHIHESARKEPATRVFQALRIVCNQELQHLERMLHEVLPRCLKPEGLAAIITFHSLEDRLVKQAFRDSQLWHNLSPKPVTASPQEQRFNPRSRSAKLRVAKRL